jgi:hypothetical protein
MNKESREKTRGLFIDIAQQIANEPKYSDNYYIWSEILLDVEILDIRCATEAILYLKKGILVSDQYASFIDFYYQVQSGMSAWWENKVSGTKKDVASKGKRKGLTRHICIRRKRSRGSCLSKRVCSWMHGNR